MQHFARIADGIVVERINLLDTMPETVLDSDGNPIVGPDGAFVQQNRPLTLTDVYPAEIAAAMRPCPAEVTQGWRVEGEAFLPPAGAPEPTLDEAKATLSAAVNVERDAIIASGYQHNFGATAGIRTLDTRTEADRINWIGLKSLADYMIADGQGATPIPIRDASNSTFTASATTVSAAMMSLLHWFSAVMAASWSLKDAIAAAEDDDALDAVDIDAGWPD
ncbi:hypothetical protein NPA31_007145 [Aurantimonas sp. MSK8Z-1]|uniref:DUF4376 domain-containing protein n=1 Tax=Mangrovibrevibacter kandeliae TaxID=2968473 RepID=UPI002117ECEC|nr:hypothetical protein [Aurantimonas sp. MSK8Z-1]MCW4114737.1 hypothetical protein [Aurantimonas sp. MSK8Z-1]